MSESLLKRIMRNHKAQTRWIALVLCLSMIVSLGTFATLHKTAVAQTYTRKVLDCPYAAENAEQVAHTHNADCYDEEGKLVCTLPEREAHTHSDACYTETRTLTCGMEESAGHQHSDACYTEYTVNVCGLEENPGHQHTDACYTMERGELICENTDEDHVHDDSCYQWNKVLTCGHEAGEGAHTHSDACSETRRELTCGMAEGEGAHTHTDACYEITRELTCGKEELPVHVHDANCIKTIELTKEEVEKKNEQPKETAEPEESPVIPEMPVSDPTADVETAETWERDFDNLELTGNWAEDLITVAATQQGKGESSRNFETYLNDEGTAWVKNGWTRYGAWYNAPYMKWDAAFVSFCLYYAGIPTENVPYNYDPALLAQSFKNGGLFAGPDDVPAPGDLIFFDTDEEEGIDHMGIVYYVDEQNGTINTVEGDRGDEVETFGYYLSDDEIAGYGILPQNPNYVPTEEAVETPELITEDTEESEDKENTQDKDLEEETDAVEEETGSGIPMPATELNGEAGGIKVFVEAPEGAFPEGVWMYVSPVNGNNLKGLVSDAVNGEVLEVQAVDIKFYNTENEEIEPLVPIRVTMTPVRSQHASESTRVIHIDREENTEVIDQATDSAAESGDVVFDADSFSIYAIAYVVIDFEYEVDGKVYTASMPGAEVILLSQVIHELGVVEDVTAAADFAAKVENVRCSDEAAVEVTKLVGDWALRPLKDTAVQEQLAVTMQDGAVFTVQVAAHGITEASTDNAVISTVNDWYLPEDASAYSEVLTEEESSDAIAAVQAVEETAADSVAETAYQVFDIGLNDVNIDEYGDGFQVTLQLPEGTVGRDFRLYHIRDGKAEELELNTDSTELADGTELVRSVSFVTPSFSEFVLSYTVDFSYLVNGKMYDFSLPGGGFVSFTDLIEVLGIIEGTNSGENDVNSAEVTDEDALTLSDVTVSEETRKFVADVESVEFSNPDLVWVGKVETDSTVGEIKEANGLECEYSAELTEEQIEEINAQTVESGDWALISMLPFESEEPLTVTMKTGEVFTIKVTDAQIIKTVIDAKGDTWEITVTYGEDAGIPNDAELKAEEILPEDARYQEYYQKAVEAVSGETAKDNYAHL
ncbi:MAG: hypothetical protein IJV40_07655, partial [Oscillospiraceae bacterium]|nr:hypothetical protein [Oscillospiraceae bacterium]